VILLLLSHHDPARMASGEVPPLPKRARDDEEGPPGGALAAAGGSAAEGAAPGAPGAAAGAAPAAAAAGAAPALPAAAGGTDAVGAAGAATAGVPPPLPAAPVYPAGGAAAAADRAALANIASATASALAVPVESLRSAALSWERREEAFSELLQVGRDRCDPDLCVPGGHTALCIACERGDEWLVAMLLHWGADVNKQGRKEAPPLLIAATAGHDHIIRLLVRSFADASRRDTVLAAMRQIAALSGEDEDAVLTAPAVEPFPLTSRLGRKLRGWRGSKRRRTQAGGGRAGAASGLGFSGGAGAHAANEWGDGGRRLLPRAVSVRDWHVVSSRHVSAVYVHADLEAVDVMCFHKGAPQT